jgi:hypothetical protein
MKNETDEIMIILTRIMNDGGLGHVAPCQAILDVTLPIYGSGSDDF